MKLLHIGRATTNDIVVSDQTVSRTHAQLIVDDLGQATIIDLSSANGTFVNGKRISEPRRLDATDIVKVGEFLLLWRNYLHESPATPVSQHTQAQSAPAPAQVAPQERAPMPADTPDVMRKPLPWKWIGIGGGALVLILVLFFLFSGGGSGSKNLEGKWKDKEEPELWINFGPNGKYTEGFKDSVTYDSATWKAMGVDRILIEKGALEISRTYKFDGDDLRITQSGRVTVYQRADK